MSWCKKGAYNAQIYPKIRAMWVQVGSRPVVIAVRARLRTLAHIGAARLRTLAPDSFARLRTHGAHGCLTGAGGISV